MTAVQIALPAKLLSVFDGPADVRGAYGGRGSAKTRSFATMIAVAGYRFGMAGISGILLCARQYMNSLDESSLEECKRAIQSVPWLAAYYEVGEKYIASRDGRISFAFAGLDRSINAVKSKGRILVCWVDEAEPVTKGAWTTLDPTLREQGDTVAGVDPWNAELWVTWNPAKKGSGVDERFRNSKDPLVKVVELNWRDNPCFPAVLERKRLRDLKDRPDQYDHIWEGGYVKVMEGAYYATNLTEARAKGRIGKVSPDPVMTFRLFFDIGGTGAKADNVAIWVAQFIGREIRALNHYEASGQPLATHLAWMRESQYTPGTAQVWLPHDGDQQDKVFDVSYAKAFREAGYHVEVVPNQGKGAAKMRIESARRKFNSVWFNEETTFAGLEALGWYHEKKDEKREIGLGPSHDWSSHSSDAFGLMCICAENIFSESNIDDLPALNYPAARAV